LAFGCAAAASESAVETNARAKGSVIEVSPASRRPLRTALTW
jgi:hypothetical protein